MEILKRMMISILVVTFALSLSPLTAFADEGELAAMAKMNKQLMDKIDRLENRIKQVEMQPSGRVAAPAYTPSAEGGVLRAAEDINISGYVEASLSLNAQNPSRGTLGTYAFGTSSGLNGLRGFDRLDRSFTMNALKLTLSKEAPETGGIGFQADLIFGDDAKFLNGATLGKAVSTGFPTDQDNVYIENAYGIVRTPFEILGGPLEIYFGRFVTLIGVEVIETKDNWNASTGLLFNFGMPFAHTGIRMSHQLNEWMSWTVGVNNGTDQDIDSNQRKSFEAQIAVDLHERISLINTVNVGSEGLDYDSAPAGMIQTATQFIWDSIINFQITDQWGMAAESLLGRNGFGEWYGLGIWNRYEFNDWLAFSNRLEYFNDTSNARLGALGGTTAFDDGYDVYSFTLGVDFNVYQNLLTRVEYRLDVSDTTRTFDADTDHQSTFLMKATYSF